MGLLRGGQGVGYGSSPRARLESRKRMTAGKRVAIWQRCRRSAGRATAHLTSPCLSSQMLQLLFMTDQ